ncbi:MAG: hypothetical protein GY839_20190 [candidate division Zixibacteria bacterium]|nr:hypothetical protein [candidate division Zixibacteria bacterium]
MKVGCMKSLLTEHWSLTVKTMSVFFIALILFWGCGDGDDNGTGPNVAPIQPEQPIPPDGAVNWDLGERIQWYCIDEDNDLIAYDFYLGTSNPPELVGTLDTYFYNHDPLEYQTTYYWQVIADDGNDHRVTSPVWSFTTGKIYQVDDFVTNNAHKVYGRDGIIFLADDNFGMRIFDVTDTSLAGVRIDSVGSVRSTAFIYDVAIDGSEAYLVGFAGLEIFDISDSTLPVFIVPEEGAFQNDFNTEERTVRIDNDHAFMAWADTASDSDNAGIYALDITNPAIPTLAGEYFYSDGAPNDMDIANGYAYIADSLAGLVIVDITDPDNLTLAGTYETPDYTIGVHVLGTTAYVADGATGLLILDVADPANITLIGSYDTPGFARDVFVNDDFAFIADYWNGGMQIIDITDPSAPVFSASRDTRGGAAGVYVDDDYIYFADRWAGLILFEFQP